MGASRIFTLATPYDGKDLFLLKFTQSADVMTLTHPRYAPRELSRTQHYAWSLDEVDFTPQIVPPTGVGAIRGNSLDGAQPTKSYSYVVAAIAADTAEVSGASSVASVTNNYLSQADNITNVVSWTASAGAGGYNVYKLQNGIYGWIGRADGTSFTDDNIRPDTTDTPPIAQDPFAAGNWPGVVALHDQRRFFASSLAKPQTLWATAAGLYNNFSASRPIQDNDAITLTLAALQVNEVRWLVPLDNLVVLTSGAEWILRPGGNSDVLTPSSTVAKSQSQVGAAHIPPIVANNRVLFVQERGSFVRDLGYEFSADGYVGQDLSILARHLFRSRQVKDWAFAAEPDKIVWCCMSDGALLGLTYLRDQEIYAWHQHDTPGAFESVCTIGEAGRDVPYFVVRRTIDGTAHRFIERMRPLDFGDSSADAWRLDCAQQYDGDPTSALAGLDHLEGEDVVILADGAVVNGQTVTGGAVSLPFEASKVIVGLPYTGVIETLTPADPNLTGRRLNVARVTLRVSLTRGLSWGPPGKTAYEHKDRQPEDSDGPPALLSEDISLGLSGDWNRLGAIRVTTTPGAPATILAIIPEIEVGG